MDQIIALYDVTIKQLTFIDIIDIILVSIMMYWMLKLVWRTRAIQLFKGILIILVVMQVSEWLNLLTLYRVLNYIITAGAVLIIIIFQPELRRVLEQLGRVSKRNTWIKDDEQESIRVAEALLFAIQSCARSKTGALIVIEQNTGLDDVIATGTILDARVSPELVLNIFEPNTPLHDGAVIIREGRIHAAACFLPLSDSPDISHDLGTRHRAALGISEICDAVTFVVSEETGTISVAINGKITRHLDYSGLRSNLFKLFSATGKQNPLLAMFRKKETKL